MFWLRLQWLTTRVDLTSRFINLSTRLRTRSEEETCLSEAGC